MASEEAEGGGEVAAAASAEGAGAAEAKARNGDRQCAWSGRVLAARHVPGDGCLQPLEARPLWQGRVCDSVGRGGAAKMAGVDRVVDGVVHGVVLARCAVARRGCGRRATGRRVLFGGCSMRRGRGDVVVSA